MEHATLPEFLAADAGRSYPDRLPVSPGWQSQTVEIDILRPEAITAHIIHRVYIGVKSGLLGGHISDSMGEMCLRGSGSRPSDERI